MAVYIPAVHCVGTRVVDEIETKEGGTACAGIELCLFHEGCEVEHMLCSVEGKPRTRVRTERSDSVHSTAGCLFDQILDVIAALPGVVLISKMGPLKHTALH